METLARQGEFVPPTLKTVEEAAHYGLGLKRGRVFVDLWDMRNASMHCPVCLPKRIARLHEMNLSQQINDPIICPSCEGNC